MNDFGANPPSVGAVALAVIGEELLRGEIIDTNAAFLADTLTENGYDIVEKRTVGDRMDDIVKTVQELLERANVLIVSGGLGPTDDDMTRRAVADALHLPISHDTNVLDWMAERLRRPVSVLAKSNIRQCERIGEAELIRNAWGTAPATYLKHGEHVIVLLPGVPRELKGMMRHDILPRLLVDTPPARATAVAKRMCAGVGESTIADRIGDLVQAGNPVIGTRVNDGVIMVRAVSHGRNATDAADRLNGVMPELTRRLKDWIFADTDTTLQEVLVDLLKQRNWTITLAESCTAGLITALIGRVPGASAVLKEAHVVYSNDAKRAFAGVTDEMLDTHGAVSEAVVRTMAESLRVSAGADIAVAVSGIAGPTGGTPEKPVGTVHLAVATRQETRHRMRVFSGDRQAVQIRAAHDALDFCRLMIIGHWDG